MKLKKRSVLWLSFRLRSKESSKLVNEIVKAGNFWLKTLSLSDTKSNIVGHGVRFKRITTELFPMIEHTLREGTT